MNSLLEIIKYAGESGNHFLATFFILLAVGYFGVCGLKAIFPIFKIDRSTHNHYPEKKDV